MQPRAILIVYEPGFRLKNHKFLLTAGANIVGRGDQCIVNLPERQPDSSQQKYLSQKMSPSGKQDYVGREKSQQSCSRAIDTIGNSKKIYAANIYVTDTFLYVEALVENMVKIKLSMIIEKGVVKKKDNFFAAIQSGHRYVLPMEDIFYIGQYKCMVQIQPATELKKVNKLLNLDYFYETPGKDPQDLQMWEGRDQEKKGNQFYKQDDQLSDRTQKIQSDNEGAFDPTLVIGDNEPELFAATLDLNQIQYPDKSQKVTSLLKPKNQFGEYLSSQSKSNKSPCQSPMLKSSDRSQCKSPRAARSHQQKMRNQQFSQFSDVSLFSKNKNSQQQELYKAIKKQNKSLRSNESQQSDQDVSMPDTVKEDQDIQNMIASSKSNNNKSNKCEENNAKKQPFQQQIKKNDVKEDGKEDDMDDDDMDEMPATINDQDLPKFEFYQQQKKEIAANALSQADNLSKKVQSKSLYDNQPSMDDWFGMEDKSKDIMQVSGNFKSSVSMEQKKQQKQSHKHRITERHSLLNYEEDPRVIKITTSLEYSGYGRNDSEKNDTEQKPEFSATAGNLGRNSQKGPIKQSPRKSLFNRNCQKPKTLLKVNISGFRPTAIEKIQMRKRGYQLVKSADDPFDLFIIEKHAKQTAKILHTLLIGKTFITRDWLQSSIDWQQALKSTLSGTIEGIQWSQIEKKENIQKRKAIFQGNSFYCTSCTRDYEKLIEITGGNVVSMNKRKKMNIILDTEAEKDKFFYQKEKSAKNWKFYSKKLISESILLADAQWSKHQIDALSF